MKFGDRFVRKREQRPVHPQALYALAHPVLDIHGITEGHCWRLPYMNMHACLIVNIAGSRPLWQVSIALRGRHGPVLVYRWSPTVHRKVEAARDRILWRLGTVEPLVEAAGTAVHLQARRQWYRPLSALECAQLTPFPPAGLALTAADQQLAMKSGFSEFNYILTGR